MLRLDGDLPAHGLGSFTLKPQIGENSFVQEWTVSFFREGSQLVEEEGISWSLQNGGGDLVTANGGTYQGETWGQE